MKKQVLFLLAFTLTCSVMFGQVVWTNEGGDNSFSNDSNWDVGFFPGLDSDQVIFQGSNSADDCIVTGAQIGGWFEIGNGGTPFGKVIIKDGAHLEGKWDHWSAVGWTTKATLVVETGGTFSTASHLWLGFNPGSQSIVEIYGTVNVAGNFGINFEGKADDNSSASVTIHNGGVLNLSVLNFVVGDAGVGSFNGTISDEAIKIMGGGSITFPGDNVDNFKTVVGNDKITAPGGSVSVNYDADSDMTILTSTADPIALGVNDFASLDFELYPNPSSDFIRINSQTAISKINIFNNLGQLVSTGKQAKINISSLSVGQYVVKVQDVSGNIGVKRFVKN